MDTKYCTNCGRMIAEGANYCEFCGAAQHSMHVPAAHEATATTPLPAPDAPPAPAHQPEDPELRKKLEKTIKERHLAPNAMWLFFINYVGKTAMLLPLFAVGIYFQPYVAVGLLAYFFMLALIAALVHNHFVFDIEKDRLDITYGIIHKRSVSVPFWQIQNVNITRNLIDRILGIAKLEVESAGSSRAAKREIIGGTRSRAEGFLPGLSMKDALMMHDLILTKAMHEQGHQREDVTIR